MIIGSLLFVTEDILKYDLQTYIHIEQAIYS